MLAPRRKAITHALLGLLMVVVGCGDESLMAPGAIEELLLPAEVTEFVAAMNAHRASVGCGALSWNVEVAQVAQAHSYDMVQEGYFSHYSPNGDSPFDRLTDAGVAYSRGAENIAYGYPTGAAVLDGWLNSPGHRANIENCSLTEHGVGLHGTHWTHLFIRP